MNRTFGVSRVVQIKNNTISVDGELVFSEGAVLNKFLLSAYKHLGINYPKFYKMDTLCKFGFLGSEYLLKGNVADAISPYEKGIILQNKSSSLTTDKKYQESIKDIASPALFVYTLPNIVMGEIAIRNHFKGENTFFVAEQFDAKQLVDYTTLLFEQEILSMGVIGYVEIGNDIADVFLCLIEKNGAGKLDAEVIQQWYAGVTKMQLV